MAKKSITKLVLEIVKDILDKETQEDILEARLIVSEIRESRNLNSDLTHWDVKKENKIEVFDPELSYEITGYRPISQTQGLDFNPEWFCTARNTFLKTGKYCPYPYKSKRYNDFWYDECYKCKYGVTINGYTLTGDNYFFLNYYQLPASDVTKASGDERNSIFPIFFASHYTFFHYLQLARVLHKHCALMKARSIGFSEINASLSARIYSVIKKSRTMITCYNDKFLKTTFSKFDNALTFLNTSTLGGMFKPRLIDKELHKKSGYQRKVNGLFEDYGYRSEVIGINGSKPSNIRGDRVLLLIFDEAGSWPQLTTAIIQGQELCEVLGVPVGTMLFGGES